jgi:hypothetical protein
MGMGNRNAG